MTIGSLLTCFFACTLLASPIAFAEDYAEIERLAAEATKQLIQLNPRRAMLLQQSAGILVFPRVTKGGVVVAGDAFASGVLLKDGVPAGRYKITSPSIGLTISVPAQKDEIIIFVTPRAVDRLLSVDNWYIKPHKNKAELGGKTGAYFLREALKKDVIGFIINRYPMSASETLAGSKVSRVTRN